MNKTPTPELVDKEKRVLELRRAGATYDEIAKATGYATPQGAYVAFQRALKRTLVDSGSEEMRQTELDRLDRAQVALWPSVIAGDVKAINTLLKVMERRARYLGLDAPAKLQVETTVYDGDSIDREVERLRLILAQHSGESSSLGN